MTIPFFPFALTLPLPLPPSPSLPPALKFFPTSGQLSASSGGGGGKAGEGTKGFRGLDWDRECEWDGARAGRTTNGSSTDGDSAAPPERDFRFPLRGGGGVLSSGVFEFRAAKGVGTFPPTEVERFIWAEGVGRG